MLPTRLRFRHWTDSDELRRRCDALRQAGKPLTIENIHPEMFEYHRTRMRQIEFRTKMMIALVVLLGLLGLIMSLAPLLRGLH